jgi:anti-sigma B factor antagonist
VSVHRIDVDVHDGTVVLIAAGELDAYSAPELRASLDGAGLQPDGALVADLSKVSFLDSTALGLVVRAVNEIAERGGRARVVLPDSAARRIFEITTLDRVLPVAQSRAEALEQLRDVP